MNVRCTICSNAFEKESGYFLGAIVFAYLIGVFSLIPTLIFSLLIEQYSLEKTIILGTTQILIMHPILHRFSKLTWLHIETRLTQHLDN